MPATYIEHESESLVMDTRGAKQLFGTKDSKKWRVLCIFAHPDDEVIFGWPVFQNVEQFESVFLLCCCNNNHKGNGPGNALTDVVVENKCDGFVCLSHGNNFYRLPTRDPLAKTLSLLLIRLTDSIWQVINEFKPTHIFTHNAMGEYGHGDHRLLFNLVIRELGDYRLLQTDISLWNKCHLSATVDDTIPSIYQRHFYTLRNYIRHVELDTYWYAQMKCIYERHNAWTWGGHDPVHKTRLYCL